MRGNRGGFGSGEWRIVAFGDFAEVQPKVVLEKGTAYSFIEMAEVEPHIKFVHSNNTRIWNGNGGAKFEDGDVIFARITPCLEHGKTAKVSGLTDARGFGSTEFFVFRGREGISDPDFIYYLSRSPVLREPAIKSMIGASGRQRAQKTVVENTTIRVPGIEGQRRIASALSGYDDLIENNRRRIQLLEQSARLLYKEWFVHFRFPGHERIPVTNGMPEGWKRKSLGEILVYLESGGRPKGGAKEEGIPSIGAENVIGIGQYDYAKEKYVSEEYFGTMRKGVVRSRDVVVYKDGANIGRSSYFGDGFPHKQCAVNEHVFILRAVPEVGQNLLYFWVAQDETRQHIANLNANTAQPGVSQGKMKTLTFAQPQQSIAHLFNETVEPVVRQIFLLARENRMLSQARDLLLPRLMKGDVAEKWIRGAVDGSAD